MSFRTFNYGDAVGAGEAILGARQDRKLSDLNMALKKIEMAQAMNPKPEVPGLGQYNPGDYTPDTWAKFLSDGGPGKANPNILQRYEKPNRPYRIDTGDAIEVYGGNGVLLKRIEKELPREKHPENITAAEEAKQEAVFRWKPQIEAAVSEAKQTADARGESFTELNAMKASLPGLLSVVKNLATLSDTATYTLFGQGFDWAAKQLGFGATQGATDRAKFTAIVDNQVLPLLRQTFGAAFTAEEGNRLRATLGDADLSPAEKQAQLEAFIDQKIRDIEAKESEIRLNSNGAPGAQLSTNPDYDPLGILQ